MPPSSVSRIPGRVLIFRRAPRRLLVNAEAALFVCAQYESAAELVVEVAHGQFHSFIFTFGVHIRYAVAAEAGVKAGQGKFHVFKAYAGVDIAANHIQIGIGVEQDFVLVGLEAYLFVGFREEYVGLDTAV